MASESDHVALELSLNDNEMDSVNVPFNDKNYIFITDSTSNSGNFTSGQMQFDLKNFSSQSQWVDLKQAYVEFPIKVYASVTSAGTGNAIATNLLTTIKNGFHHFISGAQLILNGQTIQSLQPYENVATSQRIYSKWSKDTLTKYGKSCGLALDDMTADSVATLAGNNSLNNCAYATVANSVIGFDCVANNAVLHNDGVASRITLTNPDITTSTTLRNNILSASSIKTAGLANTGVVAAGATTGVIYSQCVMGTVRLCDIFDINELPMVKNLNGFLTLNLNTSTTALTGAGAGSTLANTTAVSYNITAGQTNPILINRSALTYSSSGSATITITAQVNGSTDNLVGNAGPLLTAARMIVPAYQANPKTDMALSNSSKMFATLEKIVNPFTVASGSSITYNVTSGVPNAKSLVLLPMLQNLGATANLTNPEISAFDCVPGTSGPFSVIDQLQVYLGNKPVYQYPISYSFEQWVSENSKTGAFGGMIDEQASGLLTQQLYEQNHSFVYVDLSRRADSENGASKAIQVSLKNNTQFGMKIIAIVFYEKQWVINTNSCMLQNIK